MLRRGLLILSFVLAASACASAEPAKWFNPAWVCRRSVKVLGAPKGKKQPAIASLVFSPEKLLAPYGTDIRIIDKNGREVPRIVLRADPDAKCRVLFKPRSNVDDYFLYYGNLEAAEPDNSWRPKTGIQLMEIPDPRGGFKGDTFSESVGPGGKRTGLFRDAWRTKRVAAWPKPEVIASRYVAESLPTRPTITSNALFVFRIEVKAGDKAMRIKKAGKGIAVDGILFIDNLKRRMAAGQDPDSKMLVLEPGIHTIEAWGGCTRYDPAAGKYVPFTHDTVYTLPEARTEVGKPQYIRGRKDDAYNHIERQRLASGADYWQNVGRFLTFPPGKAPRKLLALIDKFESANWDAEWRAYGGRPRHTKS
ncbi:MAG: hypothetical protein QGD94_12765, partial [Planctomycetia bacterium]|nr:hypothetical protein [Planctomycetia bacterium]